MPSNEDNNWIFWVLGGLAALLGVAGLAGMNKPVGGQTTNSPTTMTDNNPTSAPKKGCGCQAHS